ncbi:hypothetical protein JIN84_17820 [Luteolibacter yonseiensis]|uniref:Uncharacterized protein n=1 Tax=Luteolibacter yonseiensis TaxID=1144680 RepID=A0A934R7Q8_9BACT|nr:hypothetical protein [Luteolibacter yonseiensis]MBK1817483.1 hypothetical protein [Luteolibacter yonseiensis]
MTARQKLEEKGMNLNTLLILFATAGGIFTAIKVGGPLLNVPEKMAQVDQQVSAVAGQAANIERTQAVQTEALKTLAEVAKDSRDLRRDFDRSSAESEAKHKDTDRQLEGVSRRLDRLESR